MKPEQWRKVEEWFLQALDLPPDQRAGFLARVAGEQPDLAAHLASMLEAHGGESTLDHPALSHGFRESLRDPATDAVGPTLVGARVGPYELVDVIDAGGMGFVYRARRADGSFDKHVAIKLVRAGAWDRRSRRHFDLERHALARLEHPNIARLHDGGTTEDGTPYLVMEYVEGLAIDRWCDRQRLGIAQRVELFSTVCAAVHHAHQNLVVHCDIKPSNVLVTEEGEPKLLDFGIAKLLDPGDGVTATTRRFLTPEYASPEQVQGQPLTTASDVYSLGVLLYQLLAGRKPFEAGTCPTHELARRICEDPPARPSAAPSRQDRPGADVREIARNRGCTAARLRRQLAGDLDNVVLMALRKEPARRYASADQLATDLRRSREGLPVLARRDTFGYRSVKLLQRNRAAAVAGAVVLLALVVGLVGQGRLLAKERQLAGMSEELSLSYLRSIEANPYISDGGAQREDLERYLDRIVASLDAREFADPRTEYQHLRAIVDGYRAIGGSPRSGPLSERILAISRELADEDPALRADALKNAGRLDEALAIRRRLHEPPHIELALLLYARADRARWGSERAEAGPLFQQARAMVDALPRPLDPRLLDGLTSEGWHYSMLGERDRALRCVNEAVELVSSSGPGNELLLSSALKTRAGLLQEMARFDEALEDMERSLELKSLLLIPGHPSLGVIKQDYGLLLKDAQRFEEAEPVLREALEIRSRVFGTDSGDAASSRRALAKLYSDWGRWSLAESFCVEALPHYRSAGGRSLPEMLTLVGRVLLHQGRLEDALPVLEEAHDLHVRGTASAFWERQKTASVLGHLYARLGRFEEAEALLEESVPRIRADRGPAHYRTTQALFRIADFCERAGRPAESRRWLEQVTPESRRHRIVRSTIGPWLDARLGPLAVPGD